MLLKIIGVNCDCKRLIDWFHLNQLSSLIFKGVNFGKFKDTRFNMSKISHPMI